MREEKQAGMVFFKHEISTNKLPTKIRCMNFIEEHAISRTWSQVKMWVRNVIKKKKT